MAKHRCKVPDPPADTTRWLGTYGDMVTLLMAFFVMLFAVSDTNVQKFEAFIQGLAGPFNNQTLALNVVTQSDTSVNPIEMIAPSSGLEAEPRAYMAAAGPVERPDDVDEAAEAAEAARQLGQVEAEIEEVLEQSTLPITADVRDSERGLVVAITTDEVLFATGSSVISPEGRELIGEIGPILRDAPNTIVVEGHTDDQPLHRGGYTNWNLSTDRAVAVVQMLGDEVGVPFGRVSAAGYGEHRPLLPNDGPENRSKNRRVEILIVALEQPDGTGAPIPSELLADGQDPGADADQDPDVLDFSEPLPGTSTPLASIIGTPVVGPEVGAIAPPPGDGEE